MKYRTLIIILLQILFCVSSLSAKSQDNIDKPVITDAICAKLWYGCQRFDMAKALFYQSMGANSIRENDRILERMKKGDKEIGEKFIRVIQNLYGRDDAWENFKLFGFNHSELELTDELYSYYANEAKNNRIEEQTRQYEEWCMSGVPSNVKPDKRAVLYCSNKNGVIEYLNKNPELYNNRFNIRVRVDSNGGIELVNSNNRSVIADVFSHLYLKVRKPAYVEFEDIEKELPVSSVVDVTLRFELGNLTGGYYRTEIEASTKYDKKSDEWSVKITKDSKDIFAAIAGNEQDRYIDLVKFALSRLKEKPKKYIKFKLYQVEFSLTYEGDNYHGVNNYSLISDCKLNPIAEIISSQSAFSRLQNN